ncbi:MAG: hypothetical protein WAK82_13490 [Streptosporangiaceae bacterium]
MTSPALLPTVAAVAVFLSTPVSLAVMTGQVAQAIFVAVRR